MEKVIKRFNMRGKCICCKDSDGMIHRYMYDDKGNCIYSVSVDTNNIVKETWFEYDDKGNVIHYKDSDGNEI